MYRTVTQFVKLDSPLGAHLQSEGKKTTNLYNSAMFYQRQAMTGSQKKHAERQPNEHEVFHAMQEAKPEMDKIRKSTFRKRLAKLYETGDLDGYRKLKKKGYKRFHIPTKGNWIISRFDEDTLFRVLDQPDYRALQANQAQRVIQQVSDAWSSYFSEIKDRRQNPDKYTEKPKIPGYRKKGSISTVVYNNQNCKFHFDEKQEIWEMSFPSTCERLDVTGLLTVYPINQYKLCEVKAVPKPNGFEVQITYDDEIESALSTEKPLRIAAIDLGVDNIASISNNIGVTPIIIKGNVIKAYNQWYNKTIGYYKSKGAQNGMHTTKRVQSLWYRRDRFMGCMLGLIANKVVAYLIANDIDTLVCGNNRGWKQSVDMGKINNQNFAYIPYSRLIAILRNKCAEAGIRFITHEESYTSKASFLDMDNIPIYGDDDSKKYSFSGRRKHRGLYVSKNGRLINADINAASNILRKEFPDAFDGPSSLSYLMNIETWRIDFSAGKTKLGVTSAA